MYVALPGGDQPVVVKLETPAKSGDDWICAYSIDWPDRPKEFFARGFDALQAAQLAMQMVGADLYASPFYKQNKLRWGKLGDGYGFPLTPSLRHLLIGEDKKFDG